MDIKAGDTVEIYNGEKMKVKEKKKMGDNTFYKLDNDEWFIDDEIVGKVDEKDKEISISVSDCGAFAVIDGIIIAAPIVNSKKDAVNKLMDFLEGR